MRKKLICWLIALITGAAPVTQAWAACVFDGQEALGTNFTPSITSYTFPFNTALTNDEIVLFVAINAEQNITYPYPIVTSVTGGGLTWSRRFRQFGSIPTPCYSGGPCYNDAEEWTAKASAILPPGTMFIVNANSDLSFAQVNVVAVNGSGGFDSNGSLPKDGTNFTTSPSDMQVTGFSTAQAPDMALFSCNVFYGAYGGLACGYNSTDPAWTSVVGTWQGNLFTGFSLQTNLFQRSQPAPVTGITLQPFSAMAAGWIAIGDALKCNAGGAFPQVEILQ